MRATQITSIHVGIDPGVKTGFASYAPDRRAFTAVYTLEIHQAMDLVRELHQTGLLVSVTFEDARKRKFFGAADARMKRSGAGIREGIGSVKRDCSIWQGFLTSLGVQFFAVPPQAGSTKWDAATFERVTGWKGRTSNHARDAGLLVWGKS